MNKRQFIDTVRQFKALADRKHKSYADSVNALRAMYLASVTENGAGEAEQAKEAEWSKNFLAREYAPVDPAFVGDDSA